jgi:hypothetical protein
VSVTKYLQSGYPIRVVEGETYDLKARPSNTLGDWLHRVVGENWPHDFLENAITCGTGR